MLDPDEWLRKPPAIAYEIADKDITAMNTPERFPVEEGQDLLSVIGLRIYESRARRYGIHSSGGYMTKPGPPYGVRLCRPIYDWTDGDVWRAIRDNNWDYNDAYNVLHRHGVKPFQLRIGPPTMNVEGAGLLKIAQTAWPRWFDHLARRCPGVRTVAQYGKRAIQADRRLGETWETTFNRECIEKAPEWVAERAMKVSHDLIGRHHRHSTTEFPEIEVCHQCVANVGSWKQLTRFMFNGDAFAARFGGTLKPVEPEYFRPGSGKRGGKPTW
jgi:predicted phosphoadenosine phosphosulfate sulfurtransferase